MKLSQTQYNVTPPQINYFMMLWLSVIEKLLILWLLCLWILFLSHTVFKWLHSMYFISTICPNNPGWPKDSRRNIWIWETKKRPYLPFHSTLGLLPDVSILNLGATDTDKQKLKWPIIFVW